jgi:hypothetical protein
VPTEVEWLGEQRPHDIRTGQLVILAARSKPRFTAEAVAGLGLRAVNGGAARVHSQASRYGMYRFGPAAVSGKEEITRTQEHDVEHVSAATREESSAAGPALAESRQPQARSARAGR